MNYIKIYNKVKFLFILVVMLSIGMLVIELSTSTSKFQIKSDRNTNFTTNNTNNITLSKLNLLQSKSNLEHVLQQNLMCRYYTNIDLPASNKFDPQYTYRYRHVRVINVPNPKHLCNKDTQVLTAITSAAYYFDRRNAVCSNTFLQSHYGCAHIKPGFVSRTEPEPNPNLHFSTEPNRTRTLKSGTLPNSNRTRTLESGIVPNPNRTRTLKKNIPEPY